MSRNVQREGVWRLGVASHHLSFGMRLWREVFPVSFATCRTISRGASSTNWAVVCHFFAKYHVSPTLEWCRRRRSGCDGDGGACGSWESEKDLLTFLLGFPANLCSSSLGNTYLLNSTETLLPPHTSHHHPSHAQ